MYFSYKVCCGNQEFLALFNAYIPLEVTKYGECMKYIYAFLAQYKENY